MNPAPATATRRRVSSSPPVLFFGGLIAAALLVAVLALLGPASNRGEGAPGGAGPLVWKAPPRIHVAPGMPGDRILSGVVRNDSVRLAEVDAAGIRVFSAEGERLRSSAIFLGSFSRGLYAGSRRAQASDIERRRTGRLLRIGPGAEQPLTVSWRTRPGAERGARIEYGAGALPIR